LNATCTYCPVGTACYRNGASSQVALQLKPDYWRVSESSVDIQLCPIPNSCIGDNGSLASTQNLSNFGDAYCADSYTGPLCGVCVHGTYFEPVANACVACGDSGLFLLLQNHTIINTFMMFLIIFIVKLCVWITRRNHHIKLRNKGMASLEQTMSQELEKVDNAALLKEEKSSAFYSLRDKLMLNNDSMDIGSDGTITFTTKSKKYEEPAPSTNWSVVLTLIARVDENLKTQLKEDKAITTRTLIKPSNTMLQTFTYLERSEIKLKMLLCYGQVAIQLGFVLDIDFPDLYSRIVDRFYFILFDLIPSFGLRCRIDGYDYIHRLLFTCAIPTIMTIFLFVAYQVAWVKAWLKLRHELAEKKERLEILSLSVPEHLAEIFTVTELRNFKLVFMDFDVDGNGVVDKDELKAMLMRLDPEISLKEAETETDVIFREVSENALEITFPEFLTAVEHSIHRSFGADDDFVVANGEKFAMLAEMVDAKHNNNTGSWILSSWLVVGFVFLVCTSSSLLHYLNCHTFNVPEQDGEFTLPPTPCSSRCVHKTF